MISYMDMGSSQKLFYYLFDRNTLKTKFKNRYQSRKVTYNVISSSYRIARKLKRLVTKNNNWKVIQGGLMTNMKYSNHYSKWHDHRDLNYVDFMKRKFKRTFGEYLPSIRILWF